MRQTMLEAMLDSDQLDYQGEEYDELQYLDSLDKNYYNNDIGLSNQNEIDEWLLEEAGISQEDLENSKV